MSNKKAYEPIKQDGNGVTQDIPFGWKISKTSDLNVLIETTDGTQVVLVPNIDYTVTFDSRTNGTGGNVHLSVPNAEGTEAIVQRNVPDIQGSSYTTSPGFDAKEIEKSFDRNSMMIQDLSYDLKRSLKVKVGSSVLELTVPEPDAGKTLKWKDDLSGLQNSDVNIDSMDESLDIAKDCAKTSSIAAVSATQSAQAAKDCAKISEANLKILDDALNNLKYAAAGFGLFDTKYTDHVLTGTEVIGWALAGSLVTKVYPQAVENVVNTYNAGTETTYRGVVCKVLHPDGRFIADIAQKSAIDALYASSGVADFYVLDSVNERFYLPRDDWFIQGTGDPSKVNQFVEAGLPNHRHNISVRGGSGSQDFNINYPQVTNSGVYLGEHKQMAVATLASVNNPIYGNSSTVQPPSSLKLVYYKVGNTVVNESLVDVGNVLSELQLKADIDLGNIDNTAKDLISGLGIPSDKYINLTLGASGSNYTAPANGWFLLHTIQVAVAGYQRLLTRSGFSAESRTTVVESACIVNIPIKNNDVMTLSYDTQGPRIFRFYYAEGAK